MKKRLLALMLVVAAVLMTACGGKAYTPGTFTDTGYESEFLGFRYTTPDGCVLATEDELSQLMGMSLDAAGDDFTELQKKYAELTTIYEMMIADATGAANANIVLEKTNLSFSKYLEAFKEQLNGLTSMSITLKDDGQEVDLAGATYTKLTADVEANGFVMCQEYYLRKVGDRMMCITVTYADGFEAEKDAILNGFAAY